MMRNTIFTLLFLFCAPCLSHAQLNRYLISFTDKNNSPFNLQAPSVYLSDSALSRRARYNILTDSSDLPVNPAYIYAVQSIGNVRILNASKWFNRVSIETTNPDDIVTIQSLPFVKKTESIGRKAATTNSFGKWKQPNEFVSPMRHSSNNNPPPYGASTPQIQLHHTDFLHRLGFKGEHVRLAVIDAGFYHYQELPTFDSIRLNGQIKETWDFVDRQPEVNEDYLHGMQCLSIIAANMPGSFIGTAPKADFFLYRSEDAASEYPIEEHNLACAAERADSAGADICSVSLGYTTFDNASFNHSYADMNGTTCISSQAVEKGFSKGMLFVIAAGNEGSSFWRYIAAPADADHALAVGAVNNEGEVAPFSSYGPSSDNQVKPNLASQGWGAIVANPTDGQPSSGNGTSFACPNLAGVISCLWQAFKEKEQSDIIQALQQSGSRFLYPNDRVGYGIPNAMNAFVRLQKTTFSHQISFTSCKVKINLRIKANEQMKLTVERKFPGQNDFTTVSELSPSGSWNNYAFLWEEDLTNEQYTQVQYRYKMNIGADTSYFLDSILLNYHGSCITAPINKNEFSIQPNPVNDVLSIVTRFTSSSKSIWNIMNENGQILYRKYTDMPAGKHIENIDISSWSKGYYMLSISDEKGIIETKKFLKL